MNMKAFVFVVYVFLIWLSSITAVKGQDSGIALEQALFVLEGEPASLLCPTCDIFSVNSTLGYNFTWYKADNSTPITTDKLSRTYASQNKIAFFPAKSDDAGFYECVQMDSTNVCKTSVELIVYKNEDGLCYNATFTYIQSLYAQSLEWIKCPRLPRAKEKLRVMWYKECKLLEPDGDMFTAFENGLKVNNPTKEHEGHYVCKVLYVHNGETFNISRAINLHVEAPKRKLEPVIIYPKNNKIYVSIGSPVELACNVSHISMDFALSWQVNNTWAEYYLDRSRVTLENAVKSILPDGTYISTLILNISEVKSEDYGLQFVCVLEAQLRTAAYITLHPPAPSLVGPVLGCFSTLAIVIVIGVVIYKLFKVDIVLFYRAAVRPLMNKKESDGKTYDAYVMFPRGNEAQHIYPINLFVLKVLPEVLERLCGYKLFIFGRDDLPGEAVATLIDGAVKQSRRLIMILTGDTANKGFYDEFEQHIALHDALIKSKTKTILIELEKIDYTEMPESIKYIKRKQGTIPWKGDFTDQALSPNTRFWKRVRYLMPPAQDQSSGESTCLAAI
ncbi:interleukin-1 receptor type 1-like isoform X2 [Ambystoma mexicanum]|uniref:interleukin-1 receptor type 1-like isoform X2 n=1 Tax=Ambystoma mexicanum TaxID=8296 RepID=UPI0037E76838